MSRLPKSKTLALTLGLMMLASPALAHRTEIAGDVGGTLHIEPNDQPRAGEPSLTWFALTRKGGAAIALESCNCELSMYAQPYQPNDAPVQEPLLEAVSVEGYEEIPGAEITFPQTGAYELVLTGEPETTGDFQPFELRFPVTVAVGQAVTDPAPENLPATPTPPSSSTSTGDRFIPAILSAVIFLGGALLLIARSRNQRQK